jgi:hypothetical protein
MMQLGFAAGTAAALGLRQGCSARGVPPDELRQALRAAGVKLDATDEGWPDGLAEPRGFSMHSEAGDA